MASAIPIRLDCLFQKRSQCGGGAFLAIILHKVSVEKKLACFSYNFETRGLARAPAASLSRLSYSGELENERQIFSNEK